MGIAGLSFGHLLIVLVVIVLVFGTKKLRNVGGDLGAALRDFKAALGSDAEGPAERKATTDTEAAGVSAVPASGAHPHPLDNAPAGRS